MQSIGMLRSIVHHFKPETGRIPAKVIPNYRNDAVINFDNSMCLDAITKQIGFTLWQLQELESAAAQYFVLITQAKRGMGLQAGNALVEKAQRKTFGKTICEISKAGLLAGDLESRLTKLLLERNWLVHSSRATNRNAIYRNSECNNYWIGWRQ